MYTKDEQPIVAQCTPSGSGAISLIRVTGKKTRHIVAKISSLFGSKKIDQVPSHTIHAGWVLSSTQEKIDQVMFFVMDGPKTFTGQDTIEITCHNNPFIIQHIIETVIWAGARHAQNGEFTRRSFLNKKIDLVQAEAINELIAANTQQALKKSLAQLEGSLSSWIHRLEQELVKAAAWCEASFEFLDEEVEFSPQIKEHLLKLKEKINAIKQQFSSQKHIKSGIKIALLGSVNAGKSSIFNALVGTNRAIVTSIAGTTRDIIENSIYSNGTYVTFLDTAGLRTTDDIIEQEGIRRSYQIAQEADIVLLIFDGSRYLTDQEYQIYQALMEDHKKKIIIVQNKTDIATVNKHQLQKHVNCKTSASTQHTIDTLQRLIQQKINTLLDSSDAPFLINKRHLTTLTNLEHKLDTIIPMLHESPQYELIAYHLKDALEDVSELTGKSVSEMGLDTVFKEFCVGK